MFINYKFNRKEENVVISSDNGVMDTREYQDNIEDILVLEDVIEGLESKLAAEKDKRMHLIQQYRDSITKIKEFKKERKSEIKCTIIWSIISPFVFYLAFEFLCGILGLSLIDVFSTKRVIAYSLVASLFTIICAQAEPLYNCRLSKLKKLKQEKVEILKQIFKNKRYISTLCLIICENKENLRNLLENKKKDYIENMSTKVQTISYREMLEKEKVRLEQLYHDKYEMPSQLEEKQPEGMILSRFKKRKKGN